MKIEYFPDTDSLYIELADRPGADTREIVEGIVLDIDENGKAVGLDIDQASKHLDLAKLDVDKVPISTVEPTSG
ncbi:MAG: DUF2283 domain-containing protein [Verrucomicrobia subdivision 3 bacterium]|nr:DUF2283 domain-containing protein [Limisphaerales bacterium]